MVRFERTRRIPASRRLSAISQRPKDVFIVSGRSC
jgi:hypothetical protein